MKNVKYNSNVTVITYFRSATVVENFPVTVFEWKISRG